MLDPRCGTRANAAIEHGCPSSWIGIYSLWEACNDLVATNVQGRNADGWNDCRRSREFLFQSPAPGASQVTPKHQYRGGTVHDHDPVAILPNFRRTRRKLLVRGWRSNDPLKAPRRFGRQRERLQHIYEVSTTNCRNECNPSGHRVQSPSRPRVLELPIARTVHDGTRQQLKATLGGARSRGEKCGARNREYRNAHQVPNGKSNHRNFAARGTRPVWWKTVACCHRGQTTARRVSSRARLPIFTIDPKLF